MSKHTLSPAWKALQSHHAGMADVRMRDLFTRDPDRAQKSRLQAGTLLLEWRN